MNWADENYVRLFTRDTVTWESWSWQTRATFALLLRKVSRAGVLDIGKRAPAAALAIITHMPLEFTTVAADELLADGTLEQVGNSLLIPNFNAAQETRKSNAQSKREQRELEKDELRLLQIRETTTPHRQTSADGGEPRQTPADGDRSGHPPAQPSPSPAQPEKKKPQPPPEDSGAGFFLWAQELRHEAGLMAEREPHPSALATWFTKAMLDTNGDRRRLEDAYDKFTENKHWSTADPPWPFHAFMKQWTDFVPRRTG